VSTAPLLGIVPSLPCTTVGGNPVSRVLLMGRLHMTRGPRLVILLIERVEFLTEQQVRCHFVNKESRSP
jgi:hypothetical protein